MKRNLADPVGDSGYEIAAKAVLQAIQDFFAAIADDFAEPDIAVDGDEQCALAQTSGLGMRDNSWINQIVPNFGYFRLDSATINSQFGKDFW